MKKLNVLWILSLLWVCQINGQAKVIDKVVGKVGGELVLLSEVEEQFDLTSQQQGGLPPEARCNIYENTLVTKLLLNQARLDSIEVGDQEVEAQLDVRIDRILSYMNGDVRQFEDYYGQTVNEVKESFREDLRNQLLVQRMQSQLFEEVSVTPSEVKAFFNQIPVDSLPYFNSEVEIGEIVVKPEVNAVERQKTIDKIEELRQQIVDSTATFAELAERWSDDPGSSRPGVGGDLGWQKRGTFVPAFEAAAYNLEINEISEPVESQFGFHIIQLLGRRGESLRTRHILLKPSITDADLAKTRQQLDSIRRLVMVDTLNFSTAVKRFSDEDQQSYTNDGTIVNPTTGNSFFEIGDLDPEIYFTIDTMSVGNISAPLEFAQPDGSMYYRIILLKSRTNPHKASLALDYSKIKKAALESKKSEYINSWVETKIGSTYLYLDPMYKQCQNMQFWVSKMSKP